MNVTVSCSECFASTGSYGLRPLVHAPWCTQQPDMRMARLEQKLDEIIALLKPESPRPD